MRTTLACKEEPSPQPDGLAELKEGMAKIGEKVEAQEQVEQELQAAVALLADDSSTAGSSFGFGNSKPEKDKPRKPAAKRKGAKGEVLCTGCGVYKKAENFPTAHLACLECKRFLDRIYGYCQRQGEKEWWTEQRRCAKKTRRMLDHYRDLLARTDSAGNAKAVKFNVAEVRSIQRAESQVGMFDRGRLMWEEQAPRCLLMIESCVASLHALLQGHVKISVPCHA